jgi:protein SCO1/2
MRPLILLLALSSVACSTDAKVDARRFQLTGVVAGREASPARIVVAHEAVKGLMPAMSMAFEIADAAPPLSDGDRIAATLVVSDSKSWLENVSVIARSGTSGTSMPAASRAMPGAIVPDFPLLDQNGAPTALRDPAGRVSVVTFIYTRCPMPDLCPLMVKHLEAVRRRANDEGLGSRLTLFAVTLDPAFDTPAVLHAYGESVLTASNRFDQWTLATGTAPQIEDAARFFGVGYRAERGFVVHTLTTAVVSHDGRVIRMFGSNSWRPDELLDVVRQAIERAAFQ